ncbi:hypothetical protein HK405_007511 [Cladochytrium tenue]|nr:hypothetical protein HK405_007511 [Cladochytrium tenue]
MSHRSSTHGSAGRNRPADDFETASVGHALDSLERLSAAIDGISVGGHESMDDIYDDLLDSTDEVAATGSALLPHLRLRASRHAAGGAMHSRGVGAPEDDNDDGEDDEAIFADDLFNEEDDELGSGGEDEDEFEDDGFDDLDDDEDVDEDEDDGTDCIEDEVEDERTRQEREEAMQQRQAEMRRKIVEIQQDQNIPAAEKAKKIQELMTSSWTNKQIAKVSSKSPTINKLEDKSGDFNVVTQQDMARTFYVHYRRASKLQAHCCGKWFTCRFCHDEVSDHAIVRNLTTTMMCMYCSTVQPAGRTCIEETCRKPVSKYYCEDCKLWDDDPDKNIYHCRDCGICRIGKGLGIDYFHCDKCNICMAISLKGQHKCIERNLESDCPICGEYMFTSTTTVIFMPCGHCIHYKCHQEYIQTSYQCPTCFKSLANMTEYFRRIDAMLAQHQMPPEYTLTRSFVYCNDCEKKSYAKFHFLYHKCAHCDGYNTKVLQTVEAADDKENLNLTLLPKSAPLSARAYLERHGGGDTLARAPSAANSLHKSDRTRSRQPTVDAPDLGRPSGSAGGAADDGDDEDDDYEDADRAGGSAAASPVSSYGSLSDASSSSTSVSPSAAAAGTAPSPVSAPPVCGGGDGPALPRASSASDAALLGELAARLRLDSAGAVGN